MGPGAAFSGGYGGGSGDFGSRCDPLLQAEHHRRLRWHLSVMLKVKRADVGDEQDLVFRRSCLILGVECAW